MFLFKENFFNFFAKNIRFLQIFRKGNGCDNNAVTMVTYKIFYLAVALSRWAGG